MDSHTNTQSPGVPKEEASRAAETASPSQSTSISDSASAPPKATDESRYIADELEGESYVNVVHELAKAMAGTHIVMTEGNDGFVEVTFTEDTGSDQDGSDQEWLDAQELLDAYDGLTEEEKRKKKRCRPAPVLVPGRDRRRSSRLSTPRFTPTLEPVRECAGQEVPVSNGDVLAPGLQLAPGLVASLSPSPVSALLGGRPPRAENKEEESEDKSRDAPESID